MKKTLNVVETNLEEIKKMWAIPSTPIHWKKSERFFIRCNSKGQIKWEIAPVYTEKELKQRGNFNILLDEQ